MIVRHHQRDQFKHTDPMPGSWGVEVMVQRAQPSWLLRWPGRSAMAWEKLRAQQQLRVLEPALLDL